MCPENISIKVLIVDDEKHIRETISHILQKRGYIVKEAENGEEALEKIVQEKPHILILDVSMPKMNGFEVCKRLRENPNTLDIPILFLTASCVTDKFIHGMPGAPIVYSEKPFDIKYLLAQIDKLVIYSK